MADAVASIDPAASVALRLAMLLVAAKLGGDVATRIGQPAVLGELTIGIVLGNLALLGIAGLEPIEHDMFVDLLAHLGALLLLFEVGLESTVGADAQGRRARRCWSRCSAWSRRSRSAGSVGAWLLPEQGIVRARVPRRDAERDQRRHHRARAAGPRRARSATEARIILGAAVIDDVLGLVILAVVSAAIIAAADRGGILSFADDRASILGKATGFLVGSLVLGV